MIQELLNTLTSNKVLNIRNKRLDCDLSILVSLVSIIIIYRYICIHIYYIT